MEDEDITIEFGYKLNPYMYEEFKAFNPSLTKEVYNFLRGNGSEWKVICGFPVLIKYSNHKLAANHKLMMANLKVFENRYIPEYYLNPNNWKHE